MPSNRWVRALWMGMSVVRPVQTVVALTLTIRYQRNVTSTKSYHPEFIMAKPAPPREGPREASVSVALTTFNGEAFLDEQLKSLANQALTPAELVVRDDGSSDGTLQILQRFAHSAPFPVRIEQNPTRLGYRNNFIAAALACRSKYVAFCDQDDVWQTDKLAATVAALEQTSAFLCAHSARLIDAGGRDLGFESQGIRASRVYQPLSLPPWGIYRGFTMTFRRSILQLAPPSARPEDHHSPGDILAHDQWIYFLASSLGRVITLSEPLALYRQHGSNAHGVSGSHPSRTIGERFAHRHTTLLRYARSCRSRADIMAANSTGGDLDLARAARRAERYWRGLEALYRRSASIYLDRSFLRRAASVGALVGSGTYFLPSDQGLGLNGLASDLLAIVHPPTAAQHATGP